MENIRPRANVLVTNGDQFVLIFRHKNGQDYYAIPGGGIEESETPEQAAIREIQEELGFNLRDIRKVSEIKTSTRNDYNFTAETDNKEFIVTGSEKNELNNPKNLFRPEWHRSSTFRQDIPIFPIPAREMFEEYLRKIAPKINL